MSNDELRRGLEELRSKLNIVEAELAQGKPPEQAVQAVERAVSEARSNIWILLTAEHADDYDSYVGKIRVRRATEACEDILADLHAETLSPQTAGLDIFHATLRELSEECARQTSGTTLRGGESRDDE